MLAFSNDYYGMIFRATQSVELFCAYDEYDVEYDHFQVLGYDIAVKDTLIAEALKELSDRKRNVILLSYFMEMSDSDIAKEMQLVRETIYLHRKGSIKILKKIIEEIKKDEENEF